MVDEAVSPNVDSPRLSDLEPIAASSTRSFATAGDVIPLLPNLVATVSTFLFTMILPWACYWLISSVIGEEGLAGDLAAVFMTSSLLEEAGIALGIALILLVIGMVLQFWQHHRPFANAWPITAAFPVIWLLLLPEFLLRQSALLSWAVFGTALPLVFCVHWMVLVWSREALD
jgi:hypothetical protein